MAKPTRKQVAQVIARMMRSSELDREQLVREIAGYLLAERRTGELDALMREVAATRRREEGVLEADVATAFPLTEDVRQQVQSLFSADKVVINEHVDNRLLSGIKVEADGTLLDLTARRKLEMLKKRPVRSNA